MFRWQVPVPDTAHPHLPEARAVGSADLGREIEVDVFLRENQHGITMEEGRAKWASGERGEYTAEEFASAHGASNTDIGKVRVFARTHGLKFVDDKLHQGLGIVRLSGTVEELSKAFGVEAQLYEEPVEGGGTRQYRSHEGEVTVPLYLQNVVTAVVGLTDRERHSTNWSRPIAGQAIAPRNPGDIATTYGYSPIDATGTVAGVGQFGGQRVAADFDKAMTSYGIPANKRATFNDFGVNGAPAGGISDPTGADVECALDADITGALLQGAAINWVTATNDDKGNIALVSALLHGDGLPANTPLADFNSLSWNGQEDQTAVATLQAVEKVVQAGAMQGRILCQSTGDAGSTNGVADGKQHPNDCTPSTVMVGGTTLNVDASGKRVGEDGWSGSGGGVSGVFPDPGYMSTAGINPVAADTGKPGRGFPDISANADPASGYNISAGPIGGTSGSAPLVNSMLAIGAHLHGKWKGDMHNALYAARKANQGLVEVPGGPGNGAYKDAPGWNAVTGCGVPGPDLSQVLATITPLLVQAGQPALAGSALA